jgi:hypothetical protein
MRAFPARSAIPCFGGRHGCDPYGRIRMALLDGVSRSLLRKRPNPALRQRLIHLPLGPSREPLETAPIPWRSPVVPHFGEVDDPATNARDHPGRRFGPVDARCARVRCLLVASTSLPPRKCNQRRTATPEPAFVKARSSDLKLLRSRFAQT